MASLLSDQALRDCVLGLAPALPDALAARIVLLPARVASRDDLSTGAALVAARSAGLDPPVFAAQLARRLDHLPGVAVAAVAGPGFINLRFTDPALDSVLPTVLALPMAGPEPAPVEFDLPAIRLDDPDFTVQCAHARCRSVLRAARLLPDLDGFDSLSLAAFARGRFGSGPGRALLVRLDHWTRLTESAGLEQKSATIALFLRDLSACFDQLWKASHDHATLRLLHPGQTSRSLANLALVLATAQVIRSGLGLLGVGAAEEIR